MAERKSGPSAATNDTQIELAAADVDLIRRSSHIGTHGATGSRHGLVDAINVRG